jgi:tetratricopeptide (TPR) repeat protein
MANQYGTTTDMLRKWSLMTNLYPDSSIGHHNVGTVNLFYLNQFEACAEAFRNAISMIDPARRHSLAHSLGHCELALDRYDTARSIFKDNGWPECLAEVNIVQERYAEGQEIVQTAYEETDDDFLATMALYHIDQGQMAEARVLAQQFIEELDEQSLTSLIPVARMALTVTYLHGEEGSLVPVLNDSLQAASNIFYHERGRLYTPIPFLAIVGKIHSRTADIDRAIAIYELIREKSESGGIDLWRSYLKVLEGEILVSQGKISEGVISIKAAISLTETFQAHDSLAYALERNGDVSGAIEESRWIEKRRGRAFSECVNVCGLRSKNILDWNLALLRLGRLYEASGETENAKAYYRRFLKRWSNADVVPLLEEATRRLYVLESGD